MKVFQNKAVSIGLAVCCVLFIAFQFMSAKKGYGAPKRAGAPVSNAAADAVRRMAAAAAAAESAKAGIGLTNHFMPPPPLTNLDVAVVRGRLQDWLRRSGRDPFGGWGGASPRPVLVKTNAFLAKLTLNAIWQQSGGSFAVINNKIVRVGDSVENLTVSRIDPDVVLLSGPQGWRRLEMRRPKPGSVTATNRTSAIPGAAPAALTLNAP